VDHVAGPEGSPVHAVLDRRHQHPEVNGQARVHDHVGESEGTGSATHVFLHEGHALRRLYVQPARVETDALPHERKPRPVRVTPAKIQQARLLWPGAPDGVNGHETLLEQRVPDELAELGAVARRELCGCRSELCGTHVCRRCIDQVTRQRVRRGGATHEVDVGARRRG